jgi:predicted transcriptional regulator
MSALRTTRITRLDQMTVLASPVRQELLDVLARMGTVSLAEVAAALGRAPDGLYYHARLLHRAGLVESAGV